MKKIIFRFPTSKRSRYIGKNLEEAANNCLDTAERFCKSDDGTYTDQGAGLLKSANDLLNSSARYFGFRNAEEMAEYKKRHDKN